jgi:hypothetical protein
MAFSPVGNFVLFAVLFVSGFVSGFQFASIKGFIDERRELTSQGDSSKTDDPQVPINAAILYLTLILALSSIVSQWPPEGQRMPSWSSDVVFFVGVLISAFIAGRVTNLIVKLETSLIGN